MSKQFVQNKYNANDIVFAKKHPNQKLVIRRYIDQVYYCHSQEEPNGKELVYFERELVENPVLDAKNKKTRTS